MGTYNPLTGKAALGDCQSCPAGKYCDVVGINSADIVSKNCKKGYQCIGGSTTPVPTDGTLGKICAPGKYCPEGTTVEIDCPGGSYEPRQGTSSPSCQICPAGFYCPAGSAFPIDCPIKNYCPANSAAATLCPDGTYNDDQLNLEASDQCKECLTGKYCTAGVIQGRCSAGYFCDYGATSATDANKKCPTGFYCPAYNSAECSNANYTACDSCTTDACKQTNCCLWPLRCPDNHLRLTQGATQQADCSV